jgi:hypothetical protein
LRVKKFKPGKTKPLSQLFLFSNKLAKNIDTFFSGNVVFEIELKGYDFKFHEEAKSAVDFMLDDCRSRGIAPFKYMTVVVNYKPTGLTLATLSGEYEYPIAVHGKGGYAQLANIHRAKESLKSRIRAFEEYEQLTLSFVRIATCEPIKLPKRSSDAMKNQLIKTRQAILKSSDDLTKLFRKCFQPKYRT